MNIEEIRDYCLAKKAVTEGFPFGEDVLVFKVMNKMFLLTSLSTQPIQINLKMQEDLVPEYREKYADVQPGYHMNKKQWNTVVVGNGNIPRKEIFWMIDHSYNAVVKGLTKKLQKELEDA